METGRMIDKYRRLAIVHGESESVSKANQAYNQLNALKRRMFETGPETARVIMVLLNDENPHVRFNAAFDTLSIDPDKALPVLHKLAQEMGEAPLSALRTLDFWKAGTLELPDWKKPGWQHRGTQEA